MLNFAGGGRRHRTRRACRCRRSAGVQRERAGQRRRPRVERRRPGNWNSAWSAHGRRRRPDSCDIWCRRSVAPRLTLTSGIGRENGLDFDAAASARPALVLPVQAHRLRRAVVGVGAVEVVRAAVDVLDDEIDAVERVELEVARNAGGTAATFTSNPRPLYLAPSSKASTSLGLELREAALQTARARCWREAGAVEVEAARLIAARIAGVGQQIRRSACSSAPRCPTLAFLLLAAVEAAVDRVDRARQHRRRVSTRWPSALAGRRAPG